MKKFISILMAVLLFAVMSCSTDDSDASSGVSVTFDADGGKCSFDSIPVEKGGILGHLPSCEKTGFAFCGWFMEKDGKGEKLTKFTVIEKSITVYAFWLNAGANSVVITFDGNTGTPDTPALSVDKGKSLGDLLPSATKENHVFAGWNTAADGTGKVCDGKTKYKNDITLYAQWVKTRAVVTFNANGGTISASSITVDVNSKIDALPDGTKTNYIFTGWNTKSDGSGTALTTETEIVDDVTYYAQWKLDEVTVTFNANGGVCATASITVVRGRSITTLPKATKEGLNFAGWYADAECTGRRLRAPVVVADDVTYYARFILASVWDSTETPDTSWYDPVVTEYEISDANELAGLAQLVCNGTGMSGVKITLENDFILNDDHENYASWGTTPPANVWTRAGFNGRSFRGTFDGNGHTIYGLYIDSTKISNNIHVGFIGDADGAVIKNVNIENCYVDSNQIRTGALIGWASDGTVIENCSVRGIVKSSEELVAGIVGHISTNVKIRDCINYADIISTYTTDGFVAGITSDAFDGNNVIENCVNYGNIRTSSHVAGGIFGAQGDDPTSHLTISNCKNFGDIYAATYAAGGICAQDRGSGWIINCENYGKVTAGTYGAGGITGYASITPSKTWNCANYGEVKATTYGAGGILGYSSIQSDLTNCFNAGTVSVVNASQYYGGIEGQRASTSTTASYCYSTSSACDKLFGVKTYGAITGCGTVATATSPVSLAYNVTGGIEGATYTTTYADNSTTTVLSALNNYVRANTTIVANSISYVLKEWETGENGYPILKY